MCVYVFIFAFFEFLHSFTSFVEITNYTSPFHQYVRNSGMENNIFFSLGCGAMAGLLAQSITFPGDTVRCVFVFVCE